MATLYNNGGWGGGGRTMLQQILKSCPFLKNEIKTIVPRTSLKHRFPSYDCCHPFVKFDYWEFIDRRDIPVKKKDKK